jgi:hypothetical protein
MPLRRLIPLLVTLLAAAVLPIATGASATPSTGRADDRAEEARLFAPLPRADLSGRRVRVEPARYRAVRADLAGLRARLAAAPARDAGTGLRLELPAPDGSVERVEVWRSPVLAPRLAAAHPEIATYAGRSLDSPGATVALDVTPMGFHAAVRGAPGQGAWYVDPAYDRRGTTTHLSYDGGALSEADRELVEPELPPLPERTAARAAARGGEQVQRKVYRLAMVNDPTYAAYFGADNVLAEKTTLVNRVNQVYNDDLAIQLELVEETEDLNLDTWEEATGADGPCGAHPCFDPAVGEPESEDFVPGHLDFCSPETIGRNRTVVGQLVGAGNYDVGHLVLGADGGGIGFLGGVGWEYKAAGCTGLGTPTGDYFAIDYVAHELGHQFFAFHTFDGVKGNCSGGTRTEPSSVEPGSGSSVMAYAGICGRDDLQPHTDPYFSQQTLDEIRRFVDNQDVDVAEVQTVSLRDFEPGETFRLRYGSAPPVEFTLGENYGRASLQGAIRELVRAGSGDPDAEVRVAQWGFDPWGQNTINPSGVDATGFQVVFADTFDPFTGAERVDRDLLTLLPGPGVDGFVRETTRGGDPANTGHQVEATGNTAPVAKAPANRTLPVRTPFTLRGSGTDADGDDLTFLWEQDDTGGPAGTALFANRKLDGPLFRVFGDDADVGLDASLQYESPGQNRATADGRVRTFPDLRQVLRGHTNARTGKCPRPGAGEPSERTLDCFSEFLPVRGYVGTAGSARAAMHFRLTVRDGHPGAGGTGHDDVVLRLAPKRGPFLVTSQARKGTSYAGGKRIVVRWQVNGTRPLAKRVRLRLSTDGGRTFDHVLARRTANDGKVRVRLPRGRAEHARIMVEARGNYFFDVNDRGFRIRR